MPTQPVADHDVHARYVPVPPDVRVLHALAQCAALRGDRAVAAHYRSAAVAAYRLAAGLELLATPPALVEVVA